MNYTKEEIKAVTFVRDAIHSPQDVRHFMDIGRPDYAVTATIGGKEIARSSRTLKVKEVGRGVYDPVLYFAREDVDMASLAATDKTTHCPLKGDTTYYNLNLDGLKHQHVAWSYTETIVHADALKDLIAFDQTCVQIIEHTAE